MTIPNPLLRGPALAGFVLLTVSACAGGGTPKPLSGPLTAPGLAGRRLVVFPVQNVAVPGEADRELTFAFSRRSGTDRWVFPEELRRTLARSPQLDVAVDDLPVQLFLRAEVRRVGDPLYGMIRRAASLSGADFALIPAGLAFRPGPVEAPSGRLELLAAVVDVTTGRVVWLDRVEGRAETSGDPGGMARVMDALAASLVGGA